MGCGKVGEGAGSGLGVNTYRCSGVRAVETISHEGEDLAEMRREVRKQVNKNKII